jgi:pimeloyl-ACP methyl ester carboxylesterase
MSRRAVLNVATATGAAGLLAVRSSASTLGSHANSVIRDRRPSPFVTAKDGTRLYVQDWGSGRPILFVSAWALNSDFWGTHLHAVAKAGFRAVAFDRRGHGRSDAPSYGYDADTLAEDLAQVLDTLDLRDVILVSHSMGAGEAARYMTRHGGGRIARLAFVAPTTPYLVRTDDNPDAVPEEMLDGMLGIIAKNFPEWVRDNEQPFFVADTDSETRSWIKAMMLGVSLPIAITFQHSAGRADFRSDLKAIEIPALVLHGDHDASAPIALTGAKTARLLRNSRLVVYENAPHGLPLTHRDRFLQDILTFAAG